MTVALPIPLFVKKLSRKEILREAGIAHLPYGKVIAHKRQALQESRLRADPFWGKFGPLFRFLYVGFWTLFGGSIVTAILSGIATIFLLGFAALGEAPWQYALVTGAATIILALIARVLFLSIDRDPVALILDIGQLQWQRELWIGYYYRGNPVPEEARATIEAAERVGYAVKIESFCYDPFAVVGRWPRKVYIAYWNCPSFEP